MATRATCCPIRLTIRAAAAASTRQKTTGDVRGLKGLLKTGASANAWNPLRQGDVLFTLFAETGGNGGETGTRRVIEPEAAAAACARIIGAYGFKAGKPSAHVSARLMGSLIRCFINEQGQTITDFD